MSSVANVENAPSMSAQNLLKLNSACIKHGILRVKRTGMHLGKWPSKLVVLTRGCVYIYNDELAASPCSVLSLKDFAQVQAARPSGNGWCFVMTPRSDLNKSKNTAVCKTFSCVSEDDMSSWVSALLTQISLTRAEFGLNSGLTCDTSDNVCDECEGNETRPGAEDSLSEAAQVRTKPNRSYVPKGKSLLSQSENTLFQTVGSISKSVVYLATEAIESPEISQPTPKQSQAHQDTPSPPSSVLTQASTSGAVHDQCVGGFTPVKGRPCLHFEIELSSDSQGDGYVIMKSPKEQFASIGSDSDYMNYKQLKENRMI